MKNQYPQITALLVLISFATGCSLPHHTKSISTILNRHGVDNSSHHSYRCTMGAHRGASDKYTENTSEALVEANNSSKYDFIEFDVQYSLDNKIVVYHDQRLLRRFGNLSSVSNSTFAELQEISEGEIISYYDIISSLDKKLNIEIKSQGDLEEDIRLVDEIVADICARNRKDDIAISSISTDVIKYVKQTYPEIPTGQIFWIVSSTYLHFDTLTEKLYEDIHASQADYIMLYVANLRNIDALLRLKPKNKTLVFWDFDDTMFMVHKDGSDRLWGDSRTYSLLKTLRYKAYSLF